MTLNLTLCVQMVNFLIAYCIIKIYILKPALKILLAQEEYLNSLKSVIAHHHTDLKTGEQILAEQWNACKENAQARIPAHQIAQSWLIRNITPPLIITSYNEAWMKQCTDKITTHLLAKIERQ